MLVDYLHNDELDYELAVRDHPTGGTVADKRKRLRSVRRLEKDGVVFPLNLNLDFEEEIKICQAKVTELKGAVDTFNFSNARNDYKRIKARLLHVMGRLSRISGSDQMSEKGELLCACGEISDFLEETVLMLEPIRVPEMPSTLPQQDGTAGTSTDIPTNLSLGGRKESSPNNSQSLIDVDPTDLDNAIHDLQISTSVQTTITPVTQTITTTLARGNNNTAIPTGFVSQPWIVPPATTVAGISQGPYPLLIPPVPAQSFAVTCSGSSGVSVGFQPTNSQQVCRPSAPIQEGGSSRLTSSADREGNSSDSQRHFRGNSRHFDDPSKVFKTVSQWRLIFDGSSGLNTFLEGVEELRVACGFTEAQLMGVAVILFKGVALNWFRANIHSQHTWQDLVRLLRSAFLTGEYEEDVWADIRSRTQGLQERVTAYLAVMQNLFRKLSEMPSEQTRLRIIRRNLLPYIQTQLALTNIPTLEELYAACQRVEDAQSCIGRFRPPPTNPNLVTERDFMYQPPRQRQHINYIAPTSITNSGPQPQSTSGSLLRPQQVLNHSGNNRVGLICWNCQEGGHVKRDCQKPRMKRCFKCGQPSVIGSGCPRCSGNSSLTH